MRKVTITKEGYLIDPKEMEVFTISIVANIRMNLGILKRIGRISFREHQELERGLDDIIYKVDGGNENAK